MKIKYKDNKFYIGDFYDSDAEIEFIEDDMITITHTFVKEELRGRGIAKFLFKEVERYAYERNKELVATCSFAKKEISATK